MQIAALYIRVSTDDQIEYSPDAQKKSLLKYAKDHNFFVDEHYIFVDQGISGRRAEKRPAFMLMIATAKKKPNPFDVILVHKFDRFARSREDSVVYKALLRKECNVKVLSITETLEDDKFSIILESMLEAMAEYYSLNLSDEVKKGMFEKASRGEHIGNLPYGYKLEDKNLIPHPTEFLVVRKIFEMFNTGSSLLDIVRHLNVRDIRTKNNKSWTKQSLRYLLRNHVYMGYTRYNYRVPKTNQINPESEWILIQSVHQPAITKDIFEKTQAILKNNCTLLRKDTDPYQIKSWMQKLVRCKHCGSTLRILHVTRKNIRYHYFRCAKAYQGACNVNNTFSAIKLNTLLLEKFNVDFSLGNINVTMVKTVAKLNDELDILNKKLVKLHRQYELIYKAYIGEIDSLEEYKKNKENISREETEIMERIKATSTKIGPEIFKSIKLANFKSLITTDNISESDKNKAAKQFIEKINIDLMNKSINLYYYI
ncbi:MAG: hypothetical protein CVV02_04570 [Firmicutes bacterium HGW-Firmicutes-7]|nr:MAG: hypothetical protein CVV02_04570 [Firmicutes bacterium HGW-Firmicutes-7]